MEMSLYHVSVTAVLFVLASESPRAHWIPNGGNLKHEVVYSESSTSGLANEVAKVSRNSEPA